MLRGSWRVVAVVVDILLVLIIGRPLLCAIWRESSSLVPRVVVVVVLVLSTLAGMNRRVIRR